MLAHRRGHLVEVALRGPICRRLYLIIALAMLEIAALCHLLRAVDRVVYLQVLQSDLFCMRGLLIRLL